MSEKSLNSPRLPARLLSEQVANLLGFARHDIPVLTRAKLLPPLGKPKPNAVKFFAKATVERLAQDPVWLAKATNAIYNYWQNQNSRKGSGGDNTPPDESVLAA